MSEKIPAATIDTLARSIFKEASRYGFQQVDIIRLINELVELSMSDDGYENVSIADAKLTAIDESVLFSSLPIRGDRVEIRSFNGKQDAALLERWLPDRYGRYFVLSCATAQSLTVDSLANGADNHLGIVTLRDGTPIGAMAFLDHSRQQNRAELRKLIGEVTARGQGLAEDATKLWIKYGADRLGLKKIYVSTLQTQISNIRLNESIGFRVEGLLRNEVFIDGRRHDVLRMGLCI